jgi:hypothetical protein
VLNIFTALDNLVMAATTDQNIVANQTKQQTPHGNKQTPNGTTQGIP